MLELADLGAPRPRSRPGRQPTPKDSPILVRGQDETPGDVVPRRFLDVLSGSNRPRKAHWDRPVAAAAESRQRRFGLL